MEKFRKIFSGMFRMSLACVMAIGIGMFVIGCDDDDDDDNGGSPISYCDDGYTTLADGGTLNGVYTSCIEVDEDAEVTLRGKVIFTRGTILKVNPGVTFRGYIDADDADFVSYLIIDRGARIDAEGTASKPITFTSSKSDGSRGRQDWGGVIVNGYADINNGTEAYGEGDSGLYGGTNDADNSGVMNYVGIFFAGKAFTPDNELNGLALQGVGSGTELDYIQTHNCYDDGIEFFGGNVNVQHLVSTGNGDDQIDNTGGYRGKIQFAISAPIDSDTAFEHDNNEDDFAASPITAVDYYNVTALRGDGSTVRGARIRRGTQASFTNAYFAGHQDARCVTAEDAGTAVTLSSVVFDDSCGATAYTATSPATITETANVTQNVSTDYFDLSDFATLTALETAGADAFVPSATIAGTAATPPSDGFYDTSANYIGAVPASGTNWLATWTAFPAD